MQKSPLLFALALSIGLLLPCVVTAQSYVDNLKLLESKLLDSKLQLANLDEQIASLGLALSEARSNSESSAQTIAALEISLSEAQTAQDRQALQVQQSQATLTMLSASLDDSRKQAEANEVRAAANIEKLARDYERQLRLRSTILWILAGAVVAETGVLIWQLLK